MPRMLFLTIVMTILGATAAHACELTTAFEPDGPPIKTERICLKFGSTKVFSFKELPIPGSISVVQNSTSEGECVHVPFTFFADSLKLILGPNLDSGCYTVLYQPMPRQ